MGEGVGAVDAVTGGRGGWKVSSAAGIAPGATVYPQHLAGWALNK